MGGVTVIMVYRAGAAGPASTSWGGEVRHCRHSRWSHCNSRGKYLISWSFCGQDLGNTTGEENNGTYQLRAINYQRMLRHSRGCWSHCHSRGRWRRSHTRWSHWFRQAAAPCAESKTRLVPARTAFRVKSPMSHMQDSRSQILALSHFPGKRVETHLRCSLLARQR